MKSRIGMTLLLSFLLLPLVFLMAVAADYDCYCSKAVIKDLVEAPTAFSYEVARDYQWGYGMPVFRILDDAMLRPYGNCDFHRGPPWCLIPPPPPTIV